MRLCPQCETTQTRHPPERWREAALCRACLRATMRMTADIAWSAEARESQSTTATIAR